MSTGRVLARAAATVVVVLALLGRGGGHAAESYAESTAGRFLVAAPSMPDPRFAETVIYMVSHDASGAMGLVVNRILGKGPINAYMKAFDIDSGKAWGEIRLHYGGPVERSLGFVLHSADLATEHGQEVGPGLRLSGHSEVLKALSEGREPQHRLFILGYAGWGPNQLERELASEDWLVAPFDIDLLFDDDVDTKWKRARDSAGIEL